MKKSYLEALVMNRLERSKIKDWIPEFKFHPTRKWRFDFANLEHKIAVEAEGGVFSGGRHTRGSGFTADTEKYNEAVKMGFRVLRYTSQTLDKIVEDINVMI